MDSTARAQAAGRERAQETIAVAPNSAMVVR